MQVALSRSTETVTSIGSVWLVRNSVFPFVMIIIYERLLQSNSYPKVMTRGEILLLF